MNFGKILDQWENRKQPESNKMNLYIDSYLPDSHIKKEKETDKNDDYPGAERTKRLKIPPQRTLDLHGMRLKEAIKAVEAFLIKCKKEKIQKVLIIHGKGNHSKEPAVLGKKIKEYIQKSPLTGEYGVADKKWGGTGALWVFIRI